MFPGCTENFCVPILEKVSKLKFKKDFHCGYSPERINVGDKKHTLKNIKNGKLVKTIQQFLFSTIYRFFNIPLFKYYANILYFYISKDVLGTRQRGMLDSGDVLHMPKTIRITASLIVVVVK